MVFSGDIDIFLGLLEKQITAIKDLLLNFSEDNAKGKKDEISK